MKAKTKALVLAVCAVLLVATTVFVTMAYLTSKTETVNNTFTVGKVGITLDEAKVDEYGTPIQNANRVIGNAYKLIPGHEYTKDPTVHFAAKSEASWLFVKVEDGLAAIEADTKVAAQITANGWTALNGVANVYYKEVSANTSNSAVDYVVFKTFKLTEDAAVENYSDASIKITAYAVQKDGFDTAIAAWNETYGK